MFENAGLYINPTKEIQQRIENTRRLHHQTYTDGFATGAKVGVVIGLVFGVPFGALCLACYLAY